MAIHRVSWLTALPALLTAFVLTANSTPRAAVDDAANTSALWEMPTERGGRDLLLGPWGARCAPDPHSTYTFLRPKHGGVNPGMIVQDERGRVWHVKQPPHNSQGAEGPVEVVLSRVLSAVGYHQPPVYFVPSFTLVDASGTHTAPGGRFRLDEPSLKSEGSWSWHHNPFVGTRPFNGLLTILLVFNSWDLKDSNNTLYDVRREGGVDRWYVVRDLGAALGETGRLAPKRNNLDRFERQTFITGVTDGFLKFTYHGWQPGLIRQTITRDDARWAVDRLDSLNDREWRDAFRAGGYSDDVADGFIRKIKSNIDQARSVAASGRPISSTGKE